MAPEANAPALAALAKAVALKDKASPKERALIEALEKRYSADPKAERPALDAAYADAMATASTRRARIHNTPSASASLPRPSDRPSRQTTS